MSKYHQTLGLCYLNYKHMIISICVYMLLCTYGGHNYWHRNWDEEHRVFNHKLQLGTMVGSDRGVRKWHLYRQGLPDNCPLIVSMNLRTVWSIIFHLTPSPPQVKLPSMSWLLATTRHATTYQATTRQATMHHAC